MTYAEYKELVGPRPTFMGRTRTAWQYAVRWLWRSPFGWLFWNPVLKCHSVFHRPIPIKNPTPYLNGAPVPHPARSMFSVFGWGWFDGYLSEPCETAHGGHRIVQRRGRVVRKWMFGRVELREGKAD